MSTTLLKMNPAASRARTCVWQSFGSVHLSLQTWSRNERVVANVPAASVTPPSGTKLPVKASGFPLVTKSNDTRTFSTSLLLQSVAVTVKSNVSEQSLRVCGVLGVSVRKQMAEVPAVKVRLTVAFPEVAVTLGPWAAWVRVEVALPM